nr:hypothetical protein GCM10020092_090590 [Actinoplanes digitatis]
MARVRAAGRGGTPRERRGRAGFAPPGQPARRGGACTDSKAAAPAAKDPGQCTATASAGGREAELTQGAQRVRDLRGGVVAARGLHVEVFGPGGAGDRQVPQRRAPDLGGRPQRRRRLGVQRYGAAHPPRAGQAGVERLGRVGGVTALGVGDGVPGVPAQPLGGRDRIGGLERRGDLYPDDRDAGGGEPVEDLGGALPGAGEAGQVQADAEALPVEPGERGDDRLDAVEQLAGPGLEADADGPALVPGDLGEAAGEPGEDPVGGLLACLVPAGPVAEAGRGDRAADGVLRQQVGEDAGEVEGVFQPGRVAPVGVLVAALGVGRSAQRADLEPAGVELGTQPGTGAAVDREGGGEGGREPEAHPEGLHTEAITDCGVRVEVFDDGREIPGGPHVRAVAQVDDPARSVAQTHQNPSWSGASLVHSHVHRFVLRPVWIKWPRVSDAVVADRRGAMTPPSVVCLPSDTRLDRLPDQRRTRRATP